MMINFSLFKGNARSVGSWSMGLFLLLLLASTTTAKPFVSKISYYPRSDGRGYVVWVATSERVFRYDLKRQREQLTLTLFDTDLQSNVNQGQTAGPVLRHAARTIQNDVVITFDLDPNQKVEATAYPERQGSAMLVSLTFSGTAPTSLSTLEPPANSGTLDNRGSVLTTAPVSADPSLRRSTSKTATAVSGINGSSKTEPQASLRPTNAPAHAGGALIPDYDNPNVSLDSPLRAPARTNAATGNPKDYFNTTAPKPTTTGNATAPNTTSANNNPTPTGGGGAGPVSTGASTKTVADILNTDNPIRSAEVLLLESEADALARQLTVANSQNQRRQIETALDAKLGQIFDAEQTLLRNRVATLRLTATAEEKELQQRLRARKSIIAERKQNLISLATKSIETPNAST
ncbi:MAG TPA: hypothetical protein PLL64_08130, partial [Rhodothermales bacterium]|nr:hypothetical protein [Rhodothermales bacterium]